MTRRKKMLLNTSAAFMYQLIAVVCGFVLPKFLIPYYGSAVNGLINSIMQYLSIITLFEGGVGSVVNSALYKPLADKDNDEISRIIKSSRNFFNVILKILAIYILILIVLFPLQIINKYSFSYLFIGTLIFLLAVKYVAQYYLFISYRLLLNADQASYVNLSAYSVTLILNTVLTIILIKSNVSVQNVLLISTMVFFIQPIVVRIYVMKHYILNLNIVLNSEPLKQKWNGLAQHVSSVILGSTDTIVLTLFSSLENVSIYSVYYLVTHGIRQIIVTANTGIQALLGNMYAKGELEELDKTYSRAEFVFHFLVVLLFTIAGIMMLPFIRIYTRSFTDVNYITPVFSILMALAQATYCIRIPYEMMIKVAGHYRETQLSSLIEAGLNIVISIILVFKFGLVGVAIGTFIAVTYRTVYLAIYLSKNIMCRKIKYFIKHIFVDVICIASMLVATLWIKSGGSTYLDWILMAFKVSAICTIITLVLNLIFYRDILLSSIKQVFHRNKKVPYQTNI